MSECLFYHQFIYLFIQIYKQNIEQKKDKSDDLFYQKIINELIRKSYNGVFCVYVYELSPMIFDRNHQCALFFHLNHRTNYLHHP